MDEHNNTLIKVLAGAGLASVGMSIATPCMLAPLGFAMAVPPAAVLAPICYGVGLGVYYASKHKLFYEEISIPPRTPSEENRTNSKESMKA